MLRFVSDAVLTLFSLFEGNQAVVVVARCLGHCCGVLAMVGRRCDGCGGRATSSMSRAALLLQSMSNSGCAAAPAAPEINSVGAEISSFFAQKPQRALRFCSVGNQFSMLFFKLFTYTCIQLGVTPCANVNSPSFTLF